MKYENRNKGFTLIEMIVVLMIIVIVSAVGTVGMLHYLDYSMFNQNEEYARTIFSTTQTALTNLKKSGGLEDIQKRLESEISNSSVAPKEDWYDTESKISDTNLNPRYYYLNSYYYDNPDASISDNVTKPILKELIGDYIYDNDIWNHALSVEIDPYDGVVRRVWYCKQTMEFRRSESDKDIDKAADSSEDNVKFDKNKCLVYMYIGHGSSTISYEDRREKKIGLYPSSDETVATMPEDKLPDPVQNVKFENGDRLILKWDIPVSDPSEPYEYDNIVELSDESNNTAKITISKKTINELNGDPTFHNKAVSINGNGSGIEFLMRKVDNSIELSLDAIDYNKNVLDGNFTGFTTSAMRFTKYGGLKISDKIHARVYSYNGTKKSEPVDSANDDYLLFDSSSSSNNYKISNFRHLHNVRFADEANMGTSTYTITKSLDWNTSPKLIYDSESSNEPISESERLIYKPTIVKAEQTLDGHSDSGDITVSNLRVGNEGELNIGLVGINYGTIQNIHLENPIVRGGQFVGAFCGENYGTLNNLSTSGGDIIGNDSVGGIVGSSGTVNKLSGLNNSTPVAGVKNVGGIVGHASNGGVESTQGSIEASHNYETVKFDEDSTGCMYLGGVVGLCESIKFTDCSSEFYNPNNVQSMLHSIVTINSDGTLKTNGVPNELTLLLKGDYVGGFAGKAVDSTIIKGNSVTTDYILGKKFVGGLVGQFSKYSETGSAEMQSLENRATVIGHYCVGGITGSNSAIDDKGAGNINPDLAGNDDCKISYCNNFGFVSLAGNPSTGEGSYCGGITGFNNGIVKACVTDNSALMNNNMGYYYLEMLRQLSITMCKYSGGLIGHNNYILDNSGFSNNELCKNANDNPYVNPIIASFDSAGGVFGRAGDKSSQIGNIDVKGGYIQAISNAGGYIGSLCAKNYINMTGGNMECSPNYINGSSNVGGFIGNAETETIENICNLTLGNGSTIIRSNGAVGGLIGTCSSSVSLENLNVNIAEISTVNNATGGLIGSFTGEDFSMINCYSVRINNINGHGGSPSNATGGIIGSGNIKNKNFTFNNVNLYVGSITSQNILGGVIGYAGMSNTEKYTISNFNCQVSGYSNLTKVGRFIGCYEFSTPVTAIDFSSFNFSGNITSSDGPVTSNIGKSVKE